MTISALSSATSLGGTWTSRLVCLGATRLAKARANPSAFVETCFTDPAGRPLRQSRVHRELQAFLTGHRMALVELPRDHGKSTQVCARLVWELGRNPGLRIKIVCATEALAAERGRFVRRAIEGSPRLRLVFPDLQPARPWSDTRLTVARPAEVIGPSLTAMGIGSASTGSRADLLVCDDIVDVRALDSRAERDRVRDYFHNNLMNLLEPDGRFWGLCTPWHRDDLNAELKRAGAYALFRRAVGDDLEPVWPERWPREALAARLAAIGPVSFGRAYRLVPLADDSVVIPTGWVRFWTDPVEPGRMILSVDPAVSTGPRADRSAIVVLSETDGVIRCLDAVARRVSAPDLVDVIGVLDRHWKPQLILFESNAAFKGVVQLIVRQASFGPKVKEVTQARTKGSRVEALSIPVRDGKFLLKGNGAGHVDPAQQELFDEMTTFPCGEHDDLVDAAATGTEYLLEAPEPRVF